MDIFSFMYESFKFDKDKPIRLFEAFSGIGTQAMALKRLGLKVNHVGISEIDKHAIKSYKAIHGKVKNYGGIGSFERMPKDIDIDFYNNESLNVGRLVNYNNEQWIIGIEEVDTYLLYKPDDFVLVNKSEVDQDE